MREERGRVGGALGGLKFLHVSDLHIGKRLHGYSLIPDQAQILLDIVAIARREQPDAVLVAGDVYDRNQPPVEAVELLDGFLTELAQLNKPVFVISGNHDSPGRLHFASRLLRTSNIFLAGVCGELMQMETLVDEWGPVNVYLLPYVRPMWDKIQAGQESRASQAAVQEMIQASQVAPGARNVLIAHQFVAGAHMPEQSESEMPLAGGLDAVDVSCFDAFDYVALGHLHKPQAMGREGVRYAGAPLKYSLSEAGCPKSVCVAEIRQKGWLTVRTVPLRPLRDIRVVRGPIQGLIAAAQEEPKDQDFVYAELTDREPVYDALSALRQVYPNLLGLRIVHDPTTMEALPENSPAEIRSRKLDELFADFFARQNGAPMTPAQEAIMTRIFRQAQEVDV